MTGTFFVNESLLTITAREILSEVIFQKRPLTDNSCNPSESMHTNFHHQESINEIRSAVENMGIGKSTGVS